MHYMYMYIIWKGNGRHYNSVVGHQGMFLHALHVHVHINDWKGNGRHYNSLMDHLLHQGVFVYMGWFPQTRFGIGYGR